MFLTKNPALRLNLEEEEVIFWKFYLFGRVKVFATKPVLKLNLADELI